MTVILILWSWLVSGTFRGLWTTLLNHPFRTAALNAQLLPKVPKTVPACRRSCSVHTWTSSRFYEFSGAEWERSARGRWQNSSGTSSRQLCTCAGCVNGHLKQLQSILQEKSIPPPHIGFFQPWQCRQTLEITAGPFQTITKIQIKWGTRIFSSAYEMYVYAVL